MVEIQERNNNKKVLNHFKDVSVLKLKVCSIPLTIHPVLFRLWDQPGNHKLCMNAVTLGHARPFPVLGYILVKLETNELSWKCKGKKWNHQSIITRTSQVRGSENFAVWESFKYCYNHHNNYHHHHHHHSKSLSPLLQSRKRHVSSDKHQLTWKNCDTYNDNLWR